MLVFGLEIRFSQTYWNCFCFGGAFVDMAATFAALLTAVDGIDEYVEKALDVLKKNGISPTSFMVPMQGS